MSDYTGLFHNIPDLPTPFIDRPKEAEALMGHLLDLDREESVALVPEFAGFVGGGRRTLAAMACHNAEVQELFDGGIIWLYVGEKPNMGLLLSRLSELIAGHVSPLAAEQYNRVYEPEVEELDDEETIDDEEELEEESYYLIVLEDVHNPAHVYPIVQSSDTYDVLLITENPRVAAQAKALTVTVGQLTEDESVLLMAKQFDPPPAEDQLPGLLAIAERLHRWPLLMKLIGALLQHHLRNENDFGRTLNALEAAMDENDVDLLENPELEELHEVTQRVIQLCLAPFSETEQVCYKELAIFRAATPLTTISALWGMDAEATTALVQRLDEIGLLKYKNESVRLHDQIRAMVLKMLDAPQDIHAKLLAGWGDPNQLPDTYAWNNFAFHALAAKQSEKLDEVLQNFVWLQAKLNNTSIAHLLSDFTPYNFDRAMREAKSLYDIWLALTEARLILATDKSQLAEQLIARLPANEFPALEALANVAAQSKHGVWLRPERESLLETDSVVYGADDDDADEDDSPTLDDVPNSIERAYKQLRGPVEIGRAQISDFLAVGDEDGRIHVWDIKKGAGALGGLLGARPTFLLDGHDDWIGQLLVVPHTNYLISVGLDDIICLWDLTNGEEVYALEGHEATISAIGANENYLISADWQGTVVLWNIDEGDELHELAGHQAAIQTVKLISGGKRAATASRDGEIRIWDLATGTCQQTMQSDFGSVRQLITSADEKIAFSLSAVTYNRAAGISTSMVQAWDMDSGEQLTAFGIDRLVEILSIEPDGSLLVDDEIVLYLENRP